MGSLFTNASNLLGFAEVLGMLIRYYGFALGLESVEDLVKCH